jgi:hypothetical protein
VGKRTKGKEPLTIRADRGRVNCGDIQIQISLEKTFNFFFIFQYLHLVALGDTPDWLITTIKSIINSTKNTPRAPKLRFELSNEAAIHNMRLLQQYDNDLQ